MDGWGGGNAGPEAAARRFEEMKKQSHFADGAGIVRTLFGCHKQKLVAQGGSPDPTTWPTDTWGGRNANGEVLQNKADMSGGRNAGFEAAPQDSDEAKEGTDFGGGILVYTLVSPDCVVPRHVTNRDGIAPRSPRK